jgi:hypothetical protein
MIEFIFSTPPRSRYVDRHFLRGECARVRTNICGDIIDRFDEKNSELAPLRGVASQQVSLRSSSHAG